MTGVGEGRLEQARRQRRLSQFVDRSAEMALFAQVLECNELPVMVVSAEAGMGKTSLRMRMVHECALRNLLKAELEWSSLDVLDYMSVMRKLRDQLGLDPFAPFTDLINYYTDSSYTPRLDINVNLQGGSIQVAGGAQIAGSSVGDVAGVVLRDNMIVLQRPDISVPMETRREQLTQRFLQGLATLSAGQKVVLFFSVTEKMSEITYQWLWDQLLKPVIDGLSNVRAILFGQRPPPDDQDLAHFVARAQLKPLATADIEAYIAKRVSGKIEMSDERRLGMAEVMADVLGGHPGEVASAVDKFLSKNGLPL
jgi:hypothetical protein